MLFECKSDKPKYLANIFESVNTVLENGNITICKKGILINGIDGAHVALLKLSLGKDFFKSFEFNTNDNSSQDNNSENNSENNSIQSNRELYTIGLEFKTIIKILKSAEKSDTVILQYNNKNRITIRIENDFLKRKFDIKLLDIETDNISIPDINYNLNIEMNSKKYEKIISTFDITDCEEISISCINGLVKFSSNSDVSESEVILKQNKDIKDSEQSCVITNSVKLNQTTFCLKNLKGFLKGNILSDKVKIGLNIDYPIKILYSIGKDINSYLIYYLAPKIDDN
jgi:proliferating cell nuclear antigen